MTVVETESQRPGPQELSAFLDRSVKVLTHCRDKIIQLSLQHQGSQAFSIKGQFVNIFSFQPYGLCFNYLALSL